jgi:hypothetical protein
MDAYQARNGGEGMRLASSPTAPQGNVTAASHRYVISGGSQRNGTKREKCGEAAR